MNIKLFQGILGKMHRSCIIESRGRSFILARSLGPIKAVLLNLPKDANLNYIVATFSP